MSASRILLTGARGQLGFALLEPLRLLGEVLPATRDGRLPGGGSGIALNLADDPTQIRAILQRLQPSLIVNAAAYTAVDRAEAEPELAHRINAQAPALMADYAEAHGALLVHFSTDYVFAGEGSARPWSESDRTEPINVYGRSKLAGEEAIRHTCRRYLILRSAWLYAHRGQNFLRTILDRARRGETLRVVDDQIGSPTSVAVLAQASVRIIAAVLAAGSPNAAAGTYHIACRGQASWYDFAAAILEQARAAGLLSTLPDLRPITSVEWPARARRPAWSVLDATRAESAFGLCLPHWRVALGDTIAVLAESQRASAFLLGERPCPSP